MKLAENVLLTHLIDKSAIAGWVGTALSFVSKRIGYLTMAEPLLINSNLSAVELSNGKIAESPQFMVGRKLGWTLFFTGAHLSYWDQLKDSQKLLFDFQRFSFPSNATATRIVFDDLCKSLSFNGMIDKDHKGLGGVSRELAGLIRRDLFTEVKLIGVPYDQRDELSQLIDLFMALCYVQYVNWANGKAHTVENLTECYLFVNGYESRYNLLVNTWKNVDGTVPTSKKLNVQKLSSNQVTKNFTANEVYHSGTMAKYPHLKAPASVQANMLKTASLAQEARDWHGKPISINSGWRESAINKAVGGSATSAHVIGGALDCSFSGVDKTWKEQKKLAHNLAKHYVSKGLVWDQIIIYERFIHIGGVRPNNLEPRMEVFEIKRYNSTVKKYAMK